MDPCEIVYSVNLWEEEESGAPYLITLISLKHFLIMGLLLLFHDSCHCDTKISLAFILLRAKVKVLIAQSCPTLCDPRTIAQ